MRLLTPIATVLAHHHRFAATLHELEGRSDRQLADIGLTRGDIARIAWQDAERRFPLLAGPARNPTDATPSSIELAVAGQR